MKNLKSHFVFSRSQRNGIFLLVLIIIMFQVAYFFLDFSSEESISPIQQEEIARFQQKIDSLKRIAAAENEFEIFPFNPNFITDYKGYTLGMSLKEIDKLHAYREQDEWVNSVEDFQEVTGVSDSLLNEISVYFQFPEWVENAQKEEFQRKTISAKPKQDLNRATAQDLKQIYGVGEVLSARIVKYRNSIGGFVDEIQLRDVYGLSPEVIEEISQKFVVKNPPVIKKQDINTISVLQLSEVPYFNYELAREVVEFRKLRERIVSFDDLAKIKGFPFDKIDRIKLYLAIE